MLGFIIFIVVVIFAWSKFADWINKSTMNQLNEIWNDAKCPDCGVEWIIKSQMIYVDKHQHFYCPKCNKEVRIPDHLINNIEGAREIEDKCYNTHEYVMSPAEREIEEYYVQLRETEKQAKNNRNKMF